MARGIDAAKVAGLEPTIRKCFGREFGIVQVTGHDRFAADVDFADTIFSRVYNFDLHSGKRFTDGVCTEWIEVVYRDSRASFRKAVAVRDRNPEVVEKLQGLRFGERTADDDGAEFSAEVGVNLAEKFAAKARPRFAFCKSFVGRHQKIENFAFSGGKLVESCLQTLLQIFQNQRNKADVCDFVLR